MRPARVYFDLDGTLVNPAPGITRSIRYALGRLGYPVPKAKDLESWIGPPLKSSFAAHVGEDLADEAVTRYRERYAETGITECSVYPGIVDALSALLAGGFELAVATSKPHVYAAEVLDLVGLSKYFAEVWGPELDGTLSDKKELVAVAQSRSGNPSSALFGDRHFDIDAARANGITAIGVTWGFGAAEEFANADADGRFAGRHPATAH